MTQRPAVDEKCYDLALAFLSDIAGFTADDVWALAKDIQTACEDGCRAVEQRHEYDIGLDHCEISVRAYNCLTGEGIKTIGQVRDMHDGELLRIPNFGRKSLKEVRDIIANKSWVL